MHTQKELETHNLQSRENCLAITSLIADVSMTRQVTLRFYPLCCLLLAQSSVVTASCEGSPSIDDISTSSCEQYNDADSCSAQNMIHFCVWDGQSCFQDLPSECSADNSDDCNAVPGCQWHQVPTWLWLAINVPVWFLVVALCLCCFHKKMNSGDSVLPMSNNNHETAAVSNDHNDSTLIVWCWKESSRQMHRHAESTILGGGNWIKYDVASRRALEAAYQSNCRGSCQPNSQCTVDFQSMIQQNLATGFQRKVVRVDLRQAVADFVWCWQESPSRIHKHKYSTIVDHCWIKYEERLSKRLETAFQIEGVTECTLLDDDVVDFETMRMTNICTGRQCNVRKMPRLGASLQTH